MHPRLPSTQAEAGKVEEAVVVQVIEHMLDFDKQNIAATLLAQSALS